MGAASGALRLGRGAGVSVRQWRAADDLDRVRLASCAGQGAGCLPLAAEVGGGADPDPAVAQQAFRLAARRLLGLLPPGIDRVRTCGACGQPLAAYPSRVRAAHLVACGSRPPGAARGAHAYHAPHHAVAWQLQRLLEASGFEAIPEPAGLLPGSRERPADVAAFHISDASSFIAIDVRVVRLHIASALADEVAKPGCAVEGVETAKRGLYESRCIAQGGVFVPFVINEFGKLGASAQWLLSILAIRAAERQRGDFRAGRNLMARAARIRGGWRADISRALHSTIVEGQRQRLVASLRVDVDSAGLERDLGA